MQPSILLAVMLAASVLAAQDNETPPKKSLAEGLVRQCIERDGLKPPHLESGLEMAAGQGELVLMVRRQDGSLRFEATPRGLGDHGPVADKDFVAEVLEEDWVGAPKGKPAQPQPAARAKPAKLRILLSDGLVAITTDAAEVPLVAKSIDRAHLQASLRKRFAATEKALVAGQLIMEVGVDVPMQHVLTCWEIARGVGFTTVMFSPMGNVRASSDEERAVIRGLPKKFAWVAKERDGVSYYDGELLILLDGPTSFGDVVPLIMQCADVGIWQIAFAGQKDRKQRFKLPTHLSFDK